MQFWRPEKDKNEPTMGQLRGLPLEVEGSAPWVYRLVGAYEDAQNPMPIVDMNNVIRKIANTLAILGLRDSIRTNGATYRIPSSGAKRRKARSPKLSAPESSVRRVMTEIVRIRILA